MELEPKGEQKGGTKGRRDSRLPESRVGGPGHPKGVHAFLAEEATNRLLIEERGKGGQPATTF